jgi:multidrug efflux system membrane fusion protein
VIEVIVTEPITDEVTDYQDFTGRLDALKTVDIRPRVAGYIIEAPFKEGDLVHAGDVLFQIDPRPYKAQLDAAQATFVAAQAQVAVNEANLKLARITYARAKAAGSASTPLELDQDRTQEQVTEASLNLARANLGKAAADLETAKLNYEWTTVKAPLDGRISRRYVDPHNLVNADNTMLTTIVTVDPVYAYFDVDERTYLDLMGSAAGGGSLFSGLKFPVLMRLANESDFTHVGTVNFLDNRVTGNTGTIRMRGEFHNARWAAALAADAWSLVAQSQGRAGTAMGLTPYLLGAAESAIVTRNGKAVFKPGLFVRIRLPVGLPREEILISEEAILSDQGRKYVYVVNKDNKAEYRSVTLGQAVGGLRVIKEGLSLGEQVVVSGMQRVQRDKEVKKTIKAPPSPPHASLSRLLGLHRDAAKDASTAIAR